MKIADTRIDKDQDLLVCTVGMYRLFLAHGRIGHEALGLYLHFMFTARLQETNQVKANSEYLCRGLRIGKVKLKTLKALLHKLGLIEYIQKRNPNGQIAEQYTKVKLFTKKSIEVMLKAHNDDYRDKSCPTRTNTVLEVQKTSGMVNRPTGDRPQMLKEKKKMLKEKKSLSLSKSDSNGSSKKSKKEKDPSVKSLISYFHDKFKHHEGHPPTVNGGSWGKCFKTLLRTHSEETICKVIDIFFSYPKRTRFSFNAFYNTFDNLAGRVIKAASNSSQDKICPDCQKPYVGSMCNECGWSL